MIKKEELSGYTSDPRRLKLRLDQIPVPPKCPHICLVHSGHFRARPRTFWIFASCSGVNVVINERTGTIIMGSQLRISTVAIAHGNLTIQVKEQREVSQPGAFAPQGAATVVVPRSNVTVKEESRRLMIVQEGVSIGDIVQGLNALGVTPRDLISILQAIRAAGALMAELEII